MIKFTALIEKFGQQGEKTGWTYILIPAALAQQLMPGNKKSFRVKGKLDQFSIKQVALLPMGEGDFILPLNAALRKGMGKQQKGMKLEVELEVDKEAFVFNADLMACLADEKDALQQFKQLTPSHQKYFSKWVDSAKSPATQAKRIAHTVEAMLKKMNYGEMIRSLKGKT